MVVKRQNCMQARRRKIRPALWKRKGRKATRLGCIMSRMG